MFYVLNIMLREVIVYHEEIQKGACLRKYGAGAFCMFRKEVLHMAGKLTAKQKCFVDEYLLDLNATQAAIRAGYSVRNADKIGPELLGNPRVSDAISEKMAERSRRTGISQDRVIQELARVAFVNPQNVIDTETGRIKPGASEDDLACIQSVKVKKTETARTKTVEREIKLADKMRALELLGKHLGMYTDKVDMNADLDLNITIDYGDTDGH